MVERGPEKAGVGGSIPSLATIKINKLEQFRKNLSPAHPPVIRFCTGQKRAHLKAFRVCCEASGNLIICAHRGVLIADRRLRVQRKICGEVWQILLNARVELCIPSSENERVIAESRQKGVIKRDPMPRAKCWFAQLLVFPNRLTAALDSHPCAFDVSDWDRRWRQLSPAAST